MAKSRRSTRKSYLLRPSSKRKEFDTKTIGITLKVDEKVLREIESIQEKNIKAAIEIGKFSLK